MNTNNSQFGDLQQLFSSRLGNFIIAILVAVLFWQMMDFAATVSEKGLPWAYPFFRVFGGDSINGLIKLVAYTAFAYQMLELRQKGLALDRENEAFRHGLLPVQEQLVISPAEVADIKLRALQLEQRGQFFILNGLVKKCATQYRNDQSISDTIQVLEAQVEAVKNVEEGKLEEARYIIQTVPMLGFIGTIIELTRSLAIVSDKTQRAQLLEIMPGYMARAFDATIVALVLTIILTFRYHKQLEVLDTFFARARSHVMDNLISRIFKQ